MSCERHIIAPLQLDEDGLPRTTCRASLPGGRRPGWVVGEIALEELWRTVDRVRVGNEGYALLVAEDRTPDRARQSEQEAISCQRRVGNSAVDTPCSGSPPRSC